MKRTELLDILKNVKNGLATKDYLPILSCFAFDGGNYALAYNDVVAIRQRCEFPIIGCVSGPTLLGFLEASRAKEVKIGGVADNEVTIKAANSKIKLALQNYEEMPFEMPVIKPVCKFSFTKDIQAAFKLCAATCGDEQFSPEMAGLTIKADKDKFVIWSSDGASISRAELSGVELVGSKSLDVILPIEFCKNLFRMSQLFGGGQVSISSEYVIAEFPTAEDAVLFSKLISVEEPLDFDGQAGKYIAQTDKFIPIPERFESAIKRALVVLDKASAGGTNIKVEEGRFKLYTKGDYGEVSDTLVYRGEQEEGIEVIMNTPLVERIVNVCDAMYIFDMCIAFSAGEQYTHLVANKG